MVTGASSGVGREIARAMAARGHPLALIARRRDRLRRLAAELRAAYEVSVDIHVNDLSEDDSRASLRQALRSDERGLAALCNCAGAGTFGRFDVLPLEREHEQVAVQVAAVVELVHDALPGMLARRSGAILNVGSLASVQPIPHNATYAATKAFLASFSEALHVELAGTGVSCTLVSPGPVRTEFAAAAGLARLAGAGPAFLWSDPATVAGVSVASMETGRRSVVPGALNQAAALSGRLGPRTPTLRLLSAGSKRLLQLGDRRG